MAKRTKFDINNLITKEEPKYIHILKQIFSFIMTVIFMTMIFYIIAVNLIKTPQQRLLEHELLVLQKEYERQYRQYIELEKMVNDLEQKDKDIYRIIFESEAPEEKPLTNFDSLSKIKIKDLVKWNRKDLMQELARWDKIQKQYIELISYITKKSDSLQNIPSIQPLPNNNLQFVVYGYGTKIDPIYKTPSFHNGIDFSAPGGTPVFATANGHVISSQKNNKNLGLHVKIDHGNGFITLYSHLSELRVSKGQKVKRGDIIGYVGNTGKALLPHLHYSVFYKQNALNPIYFFFAELSPQKFYKLKIIAQRSGISLD